MSAAPAGVIEFIPSGFGGGWMIPLSDEADDALADYFGERGAGLPPIGGTYGYIIEPQDLRDAVETLRAAGNEVAL